MASAAVLPGRLSQPSGKTDHRWFASAEVERMLAANELADLDAAFARGEPIGSRHPEKEVATLWLSASDGPQRVYIKRQWRLTRWIPRAPDLRHGRGWLSSPVREWRGLQWMQSAGLNVSAPLALFWHGWGLRRAAIVTQSLPPVPSLWERFTAPECDKITIEDFPSLAAALIDVIDRLHAAGLCWRSMKAKHVYPERLANGEWRIWLIDCEGVHRRPTRREYAREQRQFLASLLEVSPALERELVRQKPVWIGS